MILAGDANVSDEAASGERLWVQRAARLAFQDEANGSGLNPQLWLRSGSSLIAQLICASGFRAATCPCHGNEKLRPPPGAACSPCVFFCCMMTNMPSLAFLSLLLCSGCTGMWDKVTCWPSADVGEEVTIPCPHYLFYFSGDDAHPRKNHVSGTCLACVRLCEGFRSSGWLFFSSPSCGRAAQGSRLPQGVPVSLRSEIRGFGSFLNLGLKPEGPVVLLVLIGTICPFPLK